MTKRQIQNHGKQSFGRKPGMLLNPQKAKPLFEWASYYNPEWYSLLSAENNYASTWVGLLNSPLVRKR